MTLLYSLSTNHLLPEAEQILKLNFNLLDKTRWFFYMFNQHVCWRVCQLRVCDFTAVLLILFFGKKVIFQLCTSISLPLSLYLCLSTSISLPLHLSTSVSLPVSLSLHLSTSLSPYPCLYLCLSTLPSLYLCLSTLPSLYLCLSTPPSLYLFVSLSPPSLYLSVSLPICLCTSDGFHDSCP